MNSNKTLNKLLPNLATVMFTDIVNYSALTNHNEVNVLPILEEQKSLLRMLFFKYEGQVIKSTGDGFLVIFKSAVSAVQCAVEIQISLRERNISLDGEKKLDIRIGIHVGDIYQSQDNDIHGDAVNIASRIESTAPAKGIAVSRSVVDLIGDHHKISFKSVGRKKLKNISQELEIFTVELPWHKRKTEDNFHIFKKFVSSLLNSVKTFFLTGPVFISFTTVVCIGLLTYGLLQFISQFPIYFNNRLDPNKSDFDQKAISLNENWKYHKADKELSLEEIKNVPEDKWFILNTSKTDQYIGKLFGNYWVKTSFDVSHQFKEPAITIGIIRNSHRAYLNGKFIVTCPPYPEPFAFLHAAC